MSTIARQSAGTRIAGEAAGGQFKATERTAPSGHGLNPYPLTEGENTAAIESYIAAVFFTEEDRLSEELEGNIPGVHELGLEFTERAASDLHRFVQEHQDLVNQYVNRPEHHGRVSGFANFAHNFWLDRNGHGTGFWDRGLGELGDQLSAASKEYGEVDVEVGDDGQLHFFGGNIA